MKGVAITSTLLNTLNESFQTRFNRARGAIPGFYKKLCMECPSTAADNMYGWLADLPAVGKVTGEYIRKRLQALGYRLTNEKYGGIIDVPREAIEDDQFAIFGNVAAQFGQRAGQTPDLELITLLKSAFTTGKDYTGNAFIATDKKAFAKALPLSNKGTKKLSAANFQTARASLRNRKDAAGVPLFTLLDNSQVYLVVCADDEATATAIVETKTLEGGGDNPNYNKAQLMVLPGLENGNDRPWFLLDCGQEVKPLIYQPRVSFELTPNFSLTSDKVYNEDVFSWKTRGRMALGFGLPEYAYGSTGADAA